MFRHDPCGVSVLGAVMLSAVCLSGPACRGESSTSTPAEEPPPLHEGTWGTANPGESPDQRVLSRLDNRLTITQADFEQAVGGEVDPRYYDTIREGILRGLVERRLFELYVMDRPSLITDSEVDARIEHDMKLAGLTSFEQLQERLKEAKMPLERFRHSIRISLAQAALAEQGERVGTDLAAMRRIYDQRPDEFNGTAVHARQLMLLVSAYETADQREAKRRKLTKMREDITAGRRTWEECVRETDSRDNDGKLDPFTRYLMMNPILTEVAFSLPVGKLSDVFQTPLGFHVIEVRERIPGTRPFEDVTRNMRRWLMQEPYTRAIMEANKRYAVVGVQPPLKPADLAGRNESELDKLLRSGKWPPRGNAPASQPTGTQPHSRPADAR